MSCCPRLSPWWYTKVGIAVALLLHGFGYAALGWSAASPWILPMAVGQATIGLGALVVATHYFVLKQSTRDIARPRQLVTERALYPWIRHPMYLGDFIVIVGLALLCPTPISMAVAGLSLFALAQLCRDEDRLLAQRFPVEFASYRRGTRRFIPFVF